MSEFSYAVSGGVGRFTFQRPEARNALTYAMYEGLRDVCREMPTDGSVRALIVSGAGGKAFAAGTDMTQFRAFAEPADAHAYEERMEVVFDAIERCPVPTVAAITGACTGGGASIAAACDLRVADRALKFGFPIARTLGNCLAVNNLARLRQLVSAAKVKEMLLTARLIGAEEALALGLVTEIADDPLARAEEIAAALSAHAPLTMRASKEALRRMMKAEAVADADLIELCYMSADFREGMEAFLAKRAPQWRGA
jgi:enoyl-CoA hydratase/carnithine racemase